MPVRSASCAALALALLGGLAAILSISGQGRPALAEIAMVADMLVVEQSCEEFSVNYKALDHAASSALDPFDKPTRIIVRQRMRRRELMIEEQGAAAVCDDLYRIYGPTGRQRGLISRIGSNGSPPR